VESKQRFPPFHTSDGGKVYMYNFAWNTPVFDGKLRAFHTSELPMIFRRVEYPESEGLSRQLAGTWAGFARNGNPNHAGLPNWATNSSTVLDILFSACEYI
jgi:para-nitrobenzyl esterase